MTRVDVFVDLSSSSAEADSFHDFLDQWENDESLGGVSRHTCIVSRHSLGERPLLARPDVTSLICASPLGALNEAITRAGFDQIPLLVVSGPATLGCEVVGLLCQHLERDPMIAFAVPRLHCEKGCCVARLCRHGVGVVDWLPRRVLADLPSAEVFTELMAPCILIRPEVLGNFAPLEEQFDSVVAAMLQYMARARRCGFRTILSNATGVRLPTFDCERVGAAPLFDTSAGDQALLRQMVPDLERSWRESRSQSWEQFERLYTAAAPALRAQRPTLLLDVRNATAIYNGTAHAALGTADALRATGHDWEISILADPEGARFHDLAGRFDDCQVHTTVPKRPFTAALRLSQPWHIQEMVDLHDTSLFNAYFMLDTIAWDVVYAAPPRLEGTWQFLADYADGLVFDSRFTRQLFLERFPAASAAPDVVSHFSFDPAEYVRSDVEASADEDFILVVGNHLDHKDVGPTVELLASAFPFQKIKVLGPARVMSPLVTSEPSGQLSELDIHRLYARSRCVVFPSFYEGFGFPVVTALAYGRTLIARRSALLAEIASNCDSRHGQLVEFTRRDELVDLVGQFLHGRPLSTRPLGTQVKDGKPKAWKDVGQSILGLLGEVIANPSRSRWLAREKAIHQLLAYKN